MWGGMVYSPENSAWPPKKAFLFSFVRELVFEIKLDQSHNALCVATLELASCDDWLESKPTQALLSYCVQIKPMQPKEK